MWKSSAQVFLANRQVTILRAIHRMHKCKKAIKPTTQKSIYQLVKRNALLHLRSFQSLQFNTTEHTDNRTDHQKYNTSPNEIDIREFVSL